MSNLKVMAVTGSVNPSSVTRTAMEDLAARLKDAGCSVDVLDFYDTPMPLFDPNEAWGRPEYQAAKARVLDADVIVLGTPDYHGSVSSTLKNFLDHFWKEFAGKVFATVVASHEKGLTVHDQLRTIARQCYAWTIPYGVSLQEKVDVVDGKVATDALKTRLEMLARDVSVYGKLLAGQRAADLAGSEPGMMAAHRKRG
ncbi:MAG: NADPH-dependent FMN reductase [Verrucomicrobiales bacterium]|nr:NADPH-dependent FMN reductase [Verrucomicrobiales bacterium]|tara:strand:+ start:75 stop:668 length:594 start_codon:yes stop_codon:yes gene_type:complete